MARAKGEFPNFDVGTEESQQGKGKKTSSQQTTTRMMSNVGTGGGGAQSPSNITTPGRSQVKSNIQSIYQTYISNSKFFLNKKEQHFELLTTMTRNKN